MSLDPLAFLPQGLQVIEASAGTGKTWTLAALYVRLVLGDGRPPLTPRQILVMTFTEAAMEELRDRIRARLAESARVFHGDAAACHTADAFLLDLLAQRRCRATEAGRDGDAALRNDALRLDDAARAMDEAAIFTIHGWSHRMLREHAFESTSLFEQRRVEDPQAQTLQVLQDYWRLHVYPLDADQAAGFADCAKSPQDLLRCVRDRLMELEHLPPVRQRPDAAQFLAALAPHAARLKQRKEVERRARELWRLHRGDIEAYFEKAYGNTLNGTSFAKRHRESQMARMARWSQGQPNTREDLQRYTASNQTLKSKPPGQPPPDPTGVFALLDELYVLMEPQPTKWAQLYAHATQWIAAELARRKQQRAQFDFADLLQRLHEAVHQSDGRLAQLIRTQYPVAMVDEFQDTDRLQYDTLKRIYAVEANNLHAVVPALVMIGDPKQAIYRFRGADLKVYLEARAMAGEQRYSLAGNYRSCRPLVNALNHVFSHANAPFGEVAYEQVEAKRADKVLPLQDAQGNAHAALTVWTVPDGARTRANDLRETFSAATATQVVTLLEGGWVEKPADIAVLVRTGHEAQWVRRALDKIGVASVYLSERESVYDSREALELWYVLDAVQRPRNLQAVRAAVATRLYGLGAAEREAVLADEALLEQQVEVLLNRQQQWQQMGILATVHALLRERDNAGRLLAQPEGERSLTNLLQLASLLQDASRSLQGERALLRYLGEQIGADSNRETGSDQLQLETDADLVKVVTLHKSKGLEYPVVLLPFAYGGKRYTPPKGEDSNSDDQQAKAREDQAEAVRLLYVGMTRAKRALFLAAATPAKDAAACALYTVLNRESTTDLTDRLQAWAQCPDIAITEAPPERDPPWSGGAKPPCTREARTPQRAHLSAWRSSSFTAMVNGLHESVVLPGSDEDQRREAHADGLPDAAEPAEVTLPRRAGGTWAALKGSAALGDAMHELLEWQLQQHWPLLQPSQPTPAAWTQLLQRHVRSLQLDADTAPLLSQWVQACGQASLAVDGGELTLASLQPGQLWTEMPFVLQLKGTSKQHIDELLHRYVQPGAARTPLHPQRLEGQLVGSLDLVFEHQGRWYVLDHKTNTLPAYTDEAMAAAVLGSRYDLQYSLYLVALHRLLRTRVPDYDYDRHMGGALYFFLRGVGQGGACLYRDRPPREFIQALDDGFAGRSL